MKYTDAQFERKRRCDVSLQLVSLPAREQQTEIWQIGSKRLFTTHWMEKAAGISKDKKICSDWAGLFNKKRVCVSTDANTLSVKPFVFVWLFTCSRP
ncbi:hypothetical protein [Oscillibacter sp. 1-3]|uniref:hypothetical protein n=1 Tax=Oscillibacter sp. 1-3 TaxID=1235797 RepID=UPI001A990AB2|nr:hypothetical protein [Oscillibacter sp. 1-3]